MVVAIIHGTATILKIIQNLAIAKEVIVLHWVNTRLEKEVTVIGVLI
jgi:hypothetical protein